MSQVSLSKSIGRLSTQPDIMSLLRTLHDAAKRRVPFPNREMIAAASAVQDVINAPVRSMEKMRGRPPLGSGGAEMANASRPRKLKQTHTKIVRVGRMR